VPSDKPRLRYVETRVLWILLIAFLSGRAIAQGQQLPDAPAAKPTPGFLERLTTFYHADWQPAPPAPSVVAGAATPTAETKRGLASPLSSPPFPNADWAYGGSPVIGEPDGNVYPLMTALNGAKSRTKVYGWVEVSADGSTSASRNQPENDDIYSNRSEMDQAVIYVERLPDSVQRDHVDWGYHLTALYGTDYRETTNKGYGVDQLVDHDRQYGFDPTLEYVDVYFPRVAKGMNLRVGRYISIPGIEAQLTPYNYMYSHSLLYSVDPFTDTGVLASIQVTDQMVVQVGVSASHDVAPWTPDAKPAFTGCVSYTTKSVNDNFYLCANGINDGKYAFNNLQQYDGTWYHRFNSTWHVATEMYGMYEREVPSVNGIVGPGLIEKGTDGANCRPGEVRCLAPEWAVLNYVNKQLSPHDYVSFRSDFLNDKRGQRTGYAGKLSEGTISWSHWFGSTVQLRPEARFDHAWDRRTYDYGTRTNQFTAALDAVYHF